MIDSLRKLVESLESLPPNLQEEAVRQLDPIVDRLVDRHWDELFASTPDHVWDKMLAEADAKAAAGDFKPIADCCAEDA
jgi:hypothetical protein